MSEQPSLFEQPIETEVKEIAIQSIQPPSQNNTKECIKSVGVIGILQPLLLKPLPVAPATEYEYEIVAGRRRYNSAIQFQLNEVPALIIEGETSGAQIAMCTAIENTARGSNPVAEGRAFQQVLASGQYPDLKAMAHDMGVSLQTIKKRLKLVELPDDLLDAVVMGQLKVGVAEKMAKFSEHYRPKAIQGARTALSNQEKFGHQELKHIHTQRQEDFADQMAQIDQLIDLPPTPLNFDPVELLATEVKDMAQARGVDLAELLHKLNALLNTESVPLAVEATEELEDIPWPQKPPKATDNEPQMDELLHEEQPQPTRVVLQTGTTPSAPRLKRSSKRGMP